MSSLSENVRKILSEYKFEADNSELTCILCKKIMIDAYQSFCGCNYCQGCITKYLTGENKYCVGNKEECKEAYLVLDKNIVINPRINNRILKLKICCPNQSCTFEIELNQLGNHLQGCIERSILCPFLNIGCTNERRSKSEVINHLNEEEWFHSSLLSEFIENTRNEIISFKEESRKKEIQMKDVLKEIIILNDSLNNKEKIIENQRKDLENVKIELQREKENMIQMKEMIESIQNRDIINLRNTLDKKEIVIVAMKRQMEEQRTKINGLNDDAGKRNNEVKVMKGEFGRMRDTQKKTIMEEVKKVKIDIENVKRDILHIDWRKDIEDQKKRINTLRVDQEIIEKEIRSVIKKVRNSQIYDQREFMWRVDDFSKMEDGRGRRIIFLKCSMKFYLRVRCDGNNFGFSCCILKGEFDDYLVWPMKHKIRLSLMNQDTMEVHKYEEYQFDTCLNKSGFNKPSGKWINNFIGNGSFASVKDIKESPGILSQDSLIVSFTIDH